MRRIVTTSRPSGEVLRDIAPLEGGLSEKDACSHLGGCSDIVVDVHLDPREWLDAISHDIDWEAATEADELDDIECGTPLSRRNAISYYRRNLLDVRIVYIFLSSSRVSRGQQKRTFHKSRFVRRRMVQVLYQFS